MKPVETLRTIDAFANINGQETQILTIKIRGEKPPTISFPSFCHISLDDATNFATEILIAVQRARGRE